MADRLNLRQLVPEALELLAQLDPIIEKAGIDKLQQELVKIRASQINGCAFCMNKHTKDAIAYGEDPKRLYVLSAWREARKWFSKEDQIILTLTEEVTLIGDNGVSDETYHAAVEAFGEDTTARLILAIVKINALNRVGVALRLHPF